MNYSINKNISDDPVIRNSFNRLSVATFNLSFEDWYKSGYWTEKNIPYVLMDGNKVVANVSVNIIDTVWQGKPRHYIQLGTIMTDVQYRNKGLSRYLIEVVLNEWKRKCDALYLFANETVLDFYPKFGFQKVVEYQCSSPIKHRAGQAIKLDMMNADHRNLLKTYYEKSNPFSALPMVNNYGLLMFYCSAFMKECIYFSEEHNAVAVISQDGEIPVCLDVYCDSGKSLLDIVSSMVSEEVSHVAFGFSPKDTTGFCIAPIVSDNKLFVLQNKENIFADNKIMFPMLSHA